MSELADFCLNYCRRAGALIEPAAEGTYDLLLPDALAAQWRMSALQRFAFEEVAPSIGATYLSYGHPLVEQMAGAAQREPLCALLHINQIRLEKHGLVELAREAVALPNARLVEAPRQTEARVTSHYVRFNFKAALITDEKREQLVSVTMDAQAGHAVKEVARVEEMVPLEAEPAFKNLTLAPPRWHEEKNPLARAVLQGLLERATRAALDDLSPVIDSLQRHAARYLELDRARLGEYYDQIERDLRRRAGRATDDGKRAAMEGKLAAAGTERQAKLADVEAKYRLRVELELVNLLVIAQPKIVRVVQIENRTTTINRMVVWDPLLHRVEPLVCDACGQPSSRLYLCSGGHLAHEECLLPQCVDCKRAFCKLCQDKQSTCAVCDRPVCTHSLNRCGECGRGTCREHVGLCHADQGQPAKIAAPEPAVEPKAAPALPAAAQEPEKPHLSSLRRKKMEREAAARRRQARTYLDRYLTAAGHKVEVRVDALEPVVMAAVLTSSDKVIAVRTWELIKDGIAVTCQCDRSPCSSDGLILEPLDAEEIEKGIEHQIIKFCFEYGVPPGSVAFYSLVRNTLRPLSRLVLRGAWKDDTVIAKARAAFHRSYSSAHRT